MLISPTTIADIFKDCGEKLDSMPMPKDVNYGMMRTPYGEIVFENGKVTSGSERAVKWFKNLKINI